MVKNKDWQYQDREQLELSHIKNKDWQYQDREQLELSHITGVETG